MTDLFSFQVHISGRNEAEVLVNGNVTEFNGQLITDFNGVRVIKCRHTSKYSIIFNSGISVSVEQADDILEIMLQVPPIWKGMRYWFQSALGDMMQ